MPWIRLNAREWCTSARPRERFARATGRFHEAPPGRRPFTIRPTVIAAQPGAELRLLGRLPIVFSGEHSFALTPIGSDAHTEVVQSETYRSLVVPFTGKTIAATQIEFDEVNQALKRRVEQDPGVT